jgi:predicted MPP superfamily phosphohydrolase
MFLLFVFVASTLMHAYLLRRVWRQRWPAALARHRGWLGATVLVLWSALPLAPNAWRISDSLGYVVQLGGFVWLGTVFLLFACTLFVDVLTGFGRFVSRGRAPRMRAAGAAIGAILSVIALVQGGRAPVVREEEVVVAGLRPEYDGLVIVQITDLHLGELRRARWLDQRVDEVQALRPDLIFVTGDVLNDPTHVAPLVPNLRRLHAPLGVWAVTGNHEFFGGLDRSLAVMRKAGFRVLRDEWAAIAPGLIVAGVDDLTARRQEGISVDAVGRALGGRPSGTTIFLSHTPWNGDRAAALGAALMLSGHTHDGQIWPFRYVVRLLYPRITGRYSIGDMTLLVSRGTGLWGPPMRLFYRSEILRITLRREKTATAGGSTR